MCVNAFISSLSVYQTSDGVSARVSCLYPQSQDVSARSEPALLSSETMSPHSSEVMSYEKYT